MKEQDVPQDQGPIGGITEIAYAVDDRGQYKKVSSLGWRPKNIANDQAWTVIEADIAEAIGLCKAGQRSPLAYHMAVNLMSAGLLAGYMGIFGWRVRRHLKPSVFNRLDEAMLRRYAEVFGISVAALKTVPDAPPPWTGQGDP